MATRAFVRMTTKKRIRAIGAYRHNNRLITADKNVFSEFTKNNIKVDYANGKTYRQIELEFEKLHKQKTGRKAHMESMPLREMVLLTAEHTTLNDIQNFCKFVEMKLGFKTIDINWHKDEGHYKNDVFIENRHCHIMFECFDRATGKTIRPPHGSTELLQDLAATTMKMARGKSKKLTHKVHLAPAQYRQAQIDKDKAVEKAIEENTLILDTLLTNEKQHNKNLSAVKDYISINLNETIQSNKKLSLLTQELQKTVKALEQDNNSLKLLNKTLNNELLTANSDIEKLKEQNTEITNYFLTAKKELEDLQLILDTLGIGEIKTKLKEAKKKFKADYDNTRELLKVSGIATQQDYQELKIRFTEITENLSALNKTNIHTKINDMNI